MSATQAVQKAAKELLRFHGKAKHTVQPIETIPDKNWSVNFRGNGSGHLKMDLSGLSIQEAIEKAEADNFLKGSRATHFERPLNYIRNN